MPNHNTLGSFLDELITGHQRELGASFLISSHQDIGSGMLSTTRLLTIVEGSISLTELKI